MVIRHKLLAAGTAAKSQGPALKSTPSVMSGFAPKEVVQLDPPKDDLISIEELAKCSGDISDRPIYVAIKGALILVYII